MCIICLFRLGKLSKAIQCYSRAIEFNPSFIEAYIGRANTYTEFLTEDGNKKARYIHEERCTYMHGLIIIPSLELTMSMS